jgi:hypothetical protein
MAVRINLVKTKDGNEKNIPVSTNEHFLKNWLPIAEQLNLQSVKALFYGTNIDNAFLSNLLNELKVMKQTLPDIQNLTPEMVQLFDEDLLEIINELQEEENFLEVEGWAG